jgi:SAM-dependent methyltransferase
MQQLEPPNLSGPAFDRILREVEADLQPVLQSLDVEGLARHNRGYAHYRTDSFRHFVVNERSRFIKAARWLAEGGSGLRVCDLGCFIPYLPLLLSRLGYQVSMVDRYEFFTDEFRAAVERVSAAAGVQVVDADILADDLSSIGRFDAVLLMAVVEHLHGSPLRLMRGIRAILDPEGLLLFEVPNIAEFRRRIAFLRGRSPLPDYGYYLESEYPYFGHNREMTVPEVEQLHARAGFRIERLECYDYSQTQAETLRQRMGLALKRFAPVSHKGETIMALSRPS